MTFKIIGISGAAGCGKDTAADHIIHKRPAYQKTSFADPIKAMLRVGLSLSEAQLYGSQKDVHDKYYGCTPRKLLQTLGTEWGRETVNGNIWVLAMEKHLEAITGTFIIPDIRFENEAEFVRKHGTMIHVRGYSKNIDESNHVSESGVDIHSKDYIVRNDKDLTFYLDEVFGTLLMIESHQ